MHIKQCNLVLEDGRVFPGIPLGDWQETMGEVVFNTSMSGYQEIITDPSYARQLIVLTFPLIGNCGTSSEFAESSRIQAGGLIVSECCQTPSHWQNLTPLDSYLKEQGVPGLGGVDTRSLVRHLRQHGTMRGLLTSDSLENVGVLQMRFQSWREATRHLPVYTPYTASWGGSWKVAVLDLGVKRSLLQALAASGAETVVFPGGSSMEEILQVQPDAVVVSNGPGDPGDYGQAVATTRGLVGRLPVLGVCLGHQVLALALGGKTYRLKFGHRGSNQPVKDLLRGCVHMTSQHHGYAVDVTEVSDIDVTHVNLNDGSVEGIRHRYHSAFSVQYQPDAQEDPVFERLYNIAVAGRRV